jgi:putative endonuclease
MTAPRADSGAEAERLAAAFLEARGLSIVERNYRRRCGELDLVARDGSTLVFVEVRLRRGRAFGGAAESITAAKRARLTRAGSMFGCAAPLRFDRALGALDRIRLQDVICS